MRAGSACRQQMAVGPADLQLHPALFLAGEQQRVEDPLALHALFDVGQQVALAAEHRVDEGFFLAEGVRLGVIPVLGGHGDGVQVLALEVDRPDAHAQHVRVVQVEGKHALRAVHVVADGVGMADAAAGDGEVGENLAVFAQPGDEMAVVIGGDGGVLLAVQPLAGLDDGAAVGGNFAELAQQAAGHVDQVHAQIAQHAGARDGLVEAPVEPAALPEGAVLQVLDADAHDVAQQALLEQVPGVAHGRAEAVGKTHHVDDRLLLQQVDERLRGLTGQRQRLFHVDRLAGLNRRHRAGHVHVVGRADLDRVHVRAGDQVAIVGEAPVLRHLVLFAHFFERIRVHVADGGDFHVRVFGQRGQVRALRDAAHPDQADAYFVHAIRSFRCSLFQRFVLAVAHGGVAVRRGPGGGVDQHAADVFVQVGGKGLVAGLEIEDFARAVVIAAAAAQHRAA